MPTPPAGLIITFVKERGHKRVIRYKAHKDDSPVSTIYVDRSALEKMGNPNTLEVTIKPGSKS